MHNFTTTNNFNSHRIMRLTTLLLTTISLFISTLASAQNEAGIPFNGSITSLDGRGIRARVIVENSDKQTYSDGKGRFGLTDIEPDDVLLFVARRDTLRVAVDGKQSLRIIWAREGDHYEAEEDEDLVNFGYGYVKRRESTEFTSGISGDRLRATGCTNIVDAIMICYPALTMINGELCLRSVNSARGSSAVLILCDGVETRPETINPNDVKSVEILKGANMYGFRGVNGVVLITTKSAEDQLR